ncbi:MAG TPA: bifunctional phosphopantothenoylcysteine decarboxylase/phosphopantothenate--cysteine ligase CoaBC [Actinomycetota bacterium]|nr:bifunctional phosphopantothenoylcysteine decarboxylase/phosphopantothenate--cysteine ligase CoaBC [Actinomycetota bacterium]
MTGLAGRRVLLGVCGGIAAYKAAYLARALRADGADVTAVLTASATRFVGVETFAGLTGNPVHPSLWDAGGTVVHVDLAHAADVLVIAPSTANMLAKLAHGLADDLLSAAALEFRGPVVVAPAMHTGMWSSPATQANVATLAARGVRFVGPVDGVLAHGDEGAGRFAEPDDIVEVVRAMAADLPATAAPLAGRRVVITAGPTHEPIDPVRFVGNRSSGKMGVAIATEALARGASVVLVLGPGTVSPPAGVDVIRVETAEEMRTAVLAHADADAFVMAAAVADFRPKVAADRKLKKDQGVPDLVFEPTPDILREIAAARRPGQVIVGFAAETDDVEAAGRAKLADKQLDLLVANAVGRPATGFGADTNDAAILRASGDDTPLRTWTKTELAGALWDRVAALWNDRP